MRPNPNKRPHRIKPLSTPGEFGPSAYLAEHLYKLRGLTADKMVEATQELMK